MLIDAPIEVDASRYLRPGTNTIVLTTAAPKPRIMKRPLDLPGAFRGPADRPV